MFSVDARVASRAPVARGGTRRCAGARARDVDAMRRRAARRARVARSQRAARDATRSTDRAGAMTRDDDAEDAEDEAEDARERAERLAAVVNCYDVAALSASATRASSHVREELAANDDGAEDDVHGRAVVDGDRERVDDRGGGVRVDARGARR